MFVLIMGVTGSGKTTIGKLLAATMGWRFYDADDYHSADNVRKMASGVPLTDEDRRPWLEQLHELISDHDRRGDDGVLACSALKGSYRAILSADADVAVVYLKAHPALIRSRLDSRRGHYMPPGLIASQFLDLEEPDECVIIDAALHPEQIVAAIRSRLAVPTFLTLRDAEATSAFGHSLADAVKHHLGPIRDAGLQIDLSGDLGAGKTAIVRAMLRGLGVDGPIKSPTFALLEPYTVSSLDFYHFDFYRLKEAKEFEDSGFRELFGPGRICAVEWPERAAPRLPTADISIALTIDGDGRLATVNTASELGETCRRRAMTEVQAGGGGSLPSVPARSSSR